MYQSASNKYNCIMWSSKNIQWRASCCTLLFLFLLGCNHSLHAKEVNCMKREAFLAKINLAKSAIAKTKAFFPNCSDHDTDLREKALRDLDVAENTFNDVIQLFPICPEEPKVKKHEKPVDCSQVLENGNSVSGVYTIWLKDDNSVERSLEVFCDMDTSGGGWTVIQRRGDFPTQEDFYRDWATYKRGFGIITKDFWLGNDNIYDLTNKSSYSIRFDLEDADGDKGYALYKSFSIENEGNNYRLHITGYSGDVGDGMEVHNTMEFSTKDRNNDKSSLEDCAITREGAWWYDSCYYSNLNGVYRRGSKHDLTTVNWWFWRRNACLGATEMKLKKI